MFTENHQGITLIWSEVKDNLCSKNSPQEARTINGVGAFIYLLLFYFFLGAGIDEKIYWKKSKNSIKYNKA